MLEKGSKYNGVERSLSMEIKFNLVASPILVKSFMQIMSKLDFLVGIPGGVSWDRRNREYECHKKLCMCETMRIQVQK